MALSQIGPESNAIPESEEPLASSRSGPSDTIQRVSVLAAERGGRHPRKNAKKLPLNCEGQVFADLGLLPQEALRREQEAREAYDRFRLESPHRLTPEELDRIRALAADIPSLWNAADTPVADRKEIVRALVERVTVTVHGNTERVMLRIDWIGRTSTELALRRPISHYERLDDFPRMRSLVLAKVAAGQTAEEIAECLNREGFRPPSGRTD